VGVRLTAEEITLETPYVDIACKAWGPKDGQPVFAMHGWLDNAASFDGVAEILCSGPAAVRLVAWDAPGHGKSQHRQSGPYHFMDYMADAAHCLDALGWERAHLMGHSMGAGIACMLTGGLSESVISSVFIEGLGPLTNPAEQAVKRFRQAILDETKRAVRPKARAFKLETAVGKRAEVGKMSEDSARLLVERGSRASDERFVWRSDSRLRITSRQYFDEAVVHAYLRNISCPTLLLRAEEGWPVDPEMMRARREQISGLRFEKLPGHHHLHMDDPAPTAAAVKAFWQSLPA
jgi:pimeloyl-ACP methyl ester carboxylesterase